MDLTDELLDNSPGGDRQDEQAVIICLQFPIGKFEEQKALDAITDLGDILRDVVETSGVGRYSGNMLATSLDYDTATYYLHGKSASKISQVITPIFQSIQSLSGYYIIKRYANMTEDLYQVS